MPPASKQRQIKTLELCDFQNLKFQNAILPIISQKYLWLHICFCFVLFCFWIPYRNAILLRFAYQEFRQENAQEKKFKEFWVVSRVHLEIHLDSTHLHVKTIPTGFINKHTFRQRKKQADKRIHACAMHMRARKNGWTQNLC